MKIELTIAATYLPGWGVLEGVRELLQNAKDAETALSAPMDVRMRGNVLVITNDGCTMPYEALLLGHSTKVGRSDQIGKYGEGFKLGILALLREGHAVKIRNGSEVWTPALVQSEKLNARVLAFDIQKGRKDESRVQIEISGIEAETFRDVIRPRFLWLDKDGRRKEDTIETENGSLLLAAHHKGKVFVKGIFVENKPELTVGYDLSNCDLDRDRRVIASYDFGWQSRKIWRDALAQRPSLYRPFFDLIAANAPEAYALESYDAALFPAEFNAFAAEEFKKAHGEKAIPVGNLGESEEIEHFGRTGVVVPKGLRAILERTHGTLDSVKKSLKDEAVKTYSWHELTDAEKANVKRAVAMVTPHAPVTLAEISIVDFRSESLMGTFHATDGIKLSRRILSDRSKTLATLVHEVAHRTGGDGERGHVSEIERIWEKIVEFLEPS